MESNRKTSSSKEKEEEDEEESLKKRISSHPLYGLLVETHMDCLKVGSVGDLDQSNKMKKKVAGQMSCSNSFTQPELDSFMEAYCFALSKLKEAMKEPQQETVAFINSMHLQLRELTTNLPHDSAQPSASSSEQYSSPSNSAFTPKKFEKRHSYDARVRKV